MKKSTQSGGADKEVGIFGIKAVTLGKAIEGVADKADNIVDKNVDKAQHIQLIY